MLKMELVVLVVCVIPVVTCRRVTPKSPPPECGYAYCSSEEFCDDVMGTCTGCDMICQPDVMDPECQKQCPGFTLQTVNASPKKDSTGHPVRILMVSLAGAVVVALVATIGLLYYKRESCRTSRYGDRRHDNYLSAKGHQVVPPTDDQPMVPTES